MLGSVILFSTFSRIRSMEDELRAITTNLKTMELSESAVNLGILLSRRFFEDFVLR